MIIIKTIPELRAVINEQRLLNKKIGFVPTMGALHSAHQALIKQCVAENDYTVVSIFVNPLQFGPGEDLEKYPRDLNKDSDAVKSCGADLIFFPDPEEILGGEILTYVDIDKLQNNLCGLKRPGHFRGVCTIVTKLFNIVTPDKAYFGKKDIQQLTIIKKMVKDLNFAIEIVECPIIRETDGIAFSSRNLYLSSAERKDAVVLNQAIKNAVKAIDAGELSAEIIINQIKKQINEKYTAKIDYVKIVNTDMEDVKDIKSGNILALAVFIGATRLIDNHIIGEVLDF